MRDHSVDAYGVDALGVEESVGGIKQAFGGCAASGRCLLRHPGKLADRSVRSTSGDRRRGVPTSARRARSANLDRKAARFAARTLTATCVPALGSLLITSSGARVLGRAVSSLFEEFVDGRLGGGAALILG